MRVLVCGSRKWRDQSAIASFLRGISPVVVIHGAQKSWDAVARVHYGADYYASIWAHENDIDELPFPADWEGHGKFAGPIRNQQMLDEGKPDVVIAFKDGFQMDRPDPKATGRTVHAKGGTEDCIRRAKAMGIPTYVISHG